MVFLLFLGCDRPYQELDGSSTPHAGSAWTTRRLAPLGALRADAIFLGFLPPVLVLLLEEAFINLASFRARSCSALLILRRWAFDTFFAAIGLLPCFYALVSTADECLASRSDSGIECVCQLQVFNSSCCRVAHSDLRTLLCVWSFRCLRRLLRFLTIGHRHHSTCRSYAPTVVHRAQGVFKEWARVLIEEDRSLATLWTAV